MSRSRSSPRRWRVAGPSVRWPSSPPAWCAGGSPSTWCWRTPAAPTSPRSRPRSGWSTSTCGGWLRRCSRWRATCGTSGPVAVLSVLDYVNVVCVAARGLARSDVRLVVSERNTLSMTVAHTTRRRTRADAEAGPLGLPARRCRRRRLRGGGPRPGRRVRDRGVLRAGAEQPRRHPRGDPHAEPAGLPPVVARPVPDGRARGRPARPAEGPRAPWSRPSPARTSVPGCGSSCWARDRCVPTWRRRSPGTGWPVASTCRASWTTPTRRWPPRTCSCSRPAGRARRAC